jgi:hypothetical protein
MRETHVVATSNWLESHGRQPVLVNKGELCGMDSTDKWPCIAA